MFFLLFHTGGTRPRASRTGGAAPTAGTCAKAQEQPPVSFPPRRGGEGGAAADSSRRNMGLRMLLRPKYQLRVVVLEGTIMPDLCGQLFVHMSLHSSGWANPNFFAAMYKDLDETAGVYFPMAAVMNGLHIVVR